VPGKQAYRLASTARRHLREARAWTLARWGQELTEACFIDLDTAARDLAKHHRTYRVREELASGTGHMLYPVREHCLVYVP
jgi:plasmid stabilization system protein ParE